MKMNLNADELHQLESTANWMINADPVLSLGTHDRIVLGHNLLRVIEELNDHRVQQRMERAKVELIARYAAVNALALKGVITERQVEALNAITKSTADSICGKVPGAE